MTKTTLLRRNLVAQQLAAWVLTLLISTTATAQTLKTPAWVAEAPGEFVRLIDQGNVEIVVEDDLVRKAGKAGLTVFRFAVDYDFKYRYQTLGYDREANTWQLKITAWMDQPNVQIEHRICLGSDFQPASPWESKLLRHEFDHVAISSDPRLVKMMKQALQQRREWIGKWVQPNAPSEQDIRKAILETISEEVKAIEKLVQNQYDLLDQETSHGRSEMESRTSFFTGLYSLEGIKKCNYPLTPWMSDFVKQKISTRSSLKEVEKHYLFLTP